MKRLIVLSIVLAMTLAVSAMAATTYATLINTLGDKVVVASGSSEAQSYFGKGYVLMGSDFSKPACPTCSKDEEVGVALSDVYNDVNIHGSLTTGGKYTNASTTLTVGRTITAKEFCESSVISVNSAATAAAHLVAASIDVTLPATSTLFTSCLKEVGATKTVLFANLSPTAATTTQIVAGAGIDLMEPDDGSAFDVEIGGLNRAYITITRMPTAFETGLDAVATVTEYSPAD